MEKIVKQGLLYDFYGELLTEHQRKVFEDAVYNDLSLTEIADEYGISKQGVHDLIKRCNKILESYEDKLHMIQRYEGIRQDVKMLSELSQNPQISGTDISVQLDSIANKILEELS
ncbi:MAG: YlxM family DNA-binding protein [Butyrivibrio sp.]|nr:YlxM family DNA-binding protein [Butyrivibrio sp.]